MTYSFLNQNIGISFRTKKELLNYLKEHLPMTGIINKHTNKGTTLLGIVRNGNIL